MKQFVLEKDESYRHGGKKKTLTFDEEDEAKAIHAYDKAWRGMVTLTVVELDEEYNIQKRYLHSDDEGRRYAKGSPFYAFPTVPRISKMELVQRGWINHA